MLSHFAYRPSARLLEENDLEALLLLPHETLDEGDYLLHEGFSAPGLRHFRVLEKRNPEGMTDIEWRCLAIKNGIDYHFIDNKLVMSDLHPDNLPALIDALRDVSSERAEELQRRYQAAFLDAYEAQIEGPAVYRNTFRIIEVLKAQGRAIPLLDVPAFDDASIRALDTPALEALLEGLDAQLGAGAPIDLPAYNDLDHKPYLIGDLLVIEDYASAHHYVCEHTGDAMAWYVFENGYPEFGTANDDWVGEFLHDRKQAVWIQFQREKTQPALRYVQGKLVEANFQVHDLFLMQGSILDGMIEDGECQPEPFPEDFPSLVKSWALTREPWNLEVRSIAPLLSALQVRDGRLGFERYVAIDAALLEKYVSSGTVSEHDVSSAKEIEISVELDETHRGQIMAYLQACKSAWAVSADEKQASLIGRFIDAVGQAVERAPRPDVSAPRPRGKRA